ncbi:MAG TPA: protein kinase [Kofleriaceae bacterium]|nr:protein kinase [Kofleriaceae bacterium]
MHLGEVVKDRFELEEVAGTGGMGTVYRARDLETGERVALKVLIGGAPDGAERFEREVRVLAGLRHPGIVRYIADGRTRAGELWLAMEWLEGEHLGQRLERDGLTPAEAVTLARRVAEALGAAHERGVIHRDVKPSNLILPGGDLDRVKVVDFGVARILDATRLSTRTGMMIGTPGYMAPEQVRGEREVGARADVFAVGCVLFECLTGRAAFVGDHILAVLAKIVLEATPRITDVRSDLPPALDELLVRVLSKQPDDRPRDGNQLALELARLGKLEVAERAQTNVSVQMPALTATERRLLSVVLIGNDDSPGERTIVDPPSHAPAASAEQPLLAALTDAARQFGAQLDRLASGAYIATLAGAGGTSDQVMQAARCALALKAIVPTSPVALATGRGVIGGRWPVGEAIDRAVRLLASPPRHVRLDEVTAGLLDTRFDVGGDDAGLFLAGERDAVAATRTLLGRETPCVGRDRELGMLAGLFEECIAEPIARVALVTGVEGIGKSRVRYELLRRIANRPGEHVEIWIGRGDPLRAGSPFAMIAPALRRAAGIHDGEPLEVRRQKLRARVMRNSSTDLARTTAFLGELIGAPFPDDDNVELKAARHDPMLMNDQVRRAFEHFLAVETAAQPVAIVLEDLHWGDLPTTKLIDSALRALPDRPIFVLALARPDVHEMFPRLWAERGVQELRLTELTAKTSEKLVRRVLGDRASDSLVARLVDQAGGNAFYLEELIRAVADGKGDALPETVLALVQGRLERLEVDARRVLRAASVFGAQFWRGGVTALLGTARETAARAWLDELAHRELISRSPRSRFPGEDEYVFRHALVREAAYAMLTENDRKLGHQLAGQWLELVGEGDAMLLGEHIERGGNPARAIEHYLRAAEQALAACDFAEASARADRGIRCGATGPTLGALRLVQAEAHKWAGELAPAATAGLAAMACLPRGTARWFAAASETAEASGMLDDVAQLAAIGETLRATPDIDRDAATLAARVTAMAHTAFQLFQHGNYELAQILLDRIELAAADVVDPGVVARIYQARSSRAMFAGDAGAYLESEQEAAAAFERAGDLRYACMQHGHVGYACLEIGAYAAAESYLRHALESGIKLGLSNVVATAKHNLGRALQLQGRLDEALAIETEALDAFVAMGDRRKVAGTRIYVSNILLDRGELERAEAELDLALEASLPPMRPQILASLARVRLARGRALDALDAAREAYDQLEVLGGVEEGEALIRLMLAEALLATGNRDTARAAIARAHARLVERADRITDRDTRASFLERIPENARTVALAREHNLS